MTTIARGNTFFQYLGLFCLTLLFVCFTLFNQYLWGKFVFLAIILFFFVAGIVMRKGRLNFRFDAFQRFTLLFIAFGFYTTTWSALPGETLSMMRMIALSTVGASIVYWFYWGNNIDIFLTSLKWAGYFIAIYTIFFLGFDAVKEAGAEGERMSSQAITNTNAIGVQIALSCMIHFWQILNRKSRLSTLILMLPAFYVLAATQSRTAFLSLFLGILGLYAMREANKGNLLKTVVSILVLILLGIAIIYLASKLTMFQGFFSRMTGTVNLLTGEGKVDYSTNERHFMIQLGWEYFLKNPMGGIGIACSKAITWEHLGFETYLHNNFIEMLSCGGILGFIFYYAIYVYLFVCLAKYKNNDAQYYYIFGVVWLTLMFLGDIATISYSSKKQIFYLMIHCLNVEYLKSKKNMREVYDERQNFLY